MEALDIGDGFFIVKFDMMEDTIILYGRSMDYP